MKFTILPGEYLFSEDGYHVLDERGIAKVAEVEIEVEVRNEDQISTIQAYHDFVRVKPETKNEEGAE